VGRRLRLSWARLGCPSKSRVWMHAGSANSGSASGSYLVLRHLKDFYSQATPASPGNSPAKVASKPGAIRL
jgi:hypothetical protein